MSGDRDTIPARTLREVRLWLDVAGLTPSQVPRSDSSGVCHVRATDSRGGQRQLTFHVADPDALGLGPGRSPCLGPDQLVTHAERRIAQLALDTRDERAPMTDDILEGIMQALACYEQACLFLNESGHLSPDDLKTTAGRILAQTQPERMSGATLRRRRETLRSLADAHGLTLDDDPSRRTSQGSQPRIATVAAGSYHAYRWEQVEQELVVHHGRKRHTLRLPSSIQRVHIRLHERFQAVHQGTPNRSSWFDTYLDDTHVARLGSYEATVRISRALASASGALWSDGVTGTTWTPGTPLPRPERTPPPGRTKVRIEHGATGTHIHIPAPGIRLEVHLMVLLWLALQALAGLVISAVLWSDGHTEQAAWVLGLISGSAALTALIVMVPPFWGSQHLTASQDGLQTEAHFLPGMMKRHHLRPSHEIELIRVPHPRDADHYMLVAGAGHALVARVAEQSVAFGRGLSLEEQAWILGEIELGLSR